MPRDRRLSQSFSAEEVEVLCAVFNTVRAGGDARTLMGRRAGQRLAYKILRMQQRLMVSARRAA